jgi:hypothetical protein
LPSSCCGSRGRTLRHSGRARFPPKPSPRGTCTRCSRTRSPRADRRTTGRSRSGT